MHRSPRVPHRRRLPRRHGRTGQSDRSAPALAVEQDGGQLPAGDAPETSAIRAQLLVLADMLVSSLVGSLRCRSGRPMLVRPPRGTRFKEARTSLTSPIAPPSALVSAASTRGRRPGPSDRNPRLRPTPGPDLAAGSRLATRGAALTLRPCAPMPAARQRSGRPGASPSASVKVTMRRISSVSTPKAIGRTAPASATTSYSSSISPSM